MFDVISKLLMHRQISFEKGKITLFNKPVVMFPVDMIVEVQKLLEPYGLENEIYFASKESGVRWFDNMYRLYKIQRQDVIKWGFNVINLAGWGIPKIIKMDTKEEILKFTLEAASEAKVYGPSDKAVDHYFRGSAASAGILLFKKDCDAIETKCVSKGDKICEFIVKPIKKLDKNNPLLKQQLKRKGVS